MKNNAFNLKSYKDNYEEWGKYEIFEKEEKVIVNKREKEVNGYRSNLKKVDMILKECNKTSFNTNFTSPKGNAQNPFRNWEIKVENLKNLQSEKPHKLSTEHMRNKTKLSGLMSQAKSVFSRNDPQIENIKNWRYNK